MAPITPSPNNIIIGSAVMAKAPITPSKLNEASITSKYKKRANPALPVATTKSVEVAAFEWLIVSPKPSTSIKVKIPSIPANKTAWESLAINSEVINKIMIEIIAFAAGK